MFAVLPLVIDQVLLGVLSLWLLAATFAAVHLILYGRKSSVADEPLHLILRIGQWVFFIGPMLILLLLGVGWWALPMAVVAAVIFCMCYSRRLGSQRSALVWGLAVAAKKSLPLSNTLRSLGRDASRGVAWSAARIADDIDRGASLATAMARYPRAVPPEAVLMAAAGEQTGKLSEALGEVVACETEMRPLWGQVAGKLVYLTILVLWGLMIVTFLMIKIIPAFEKIFADFELELPAMTVAVMTATGAFVNYWYLCVPFLLLTGLAMLYFSALYAAGGSSIRPPAWLFGNFDRAIALRALALAAESQTDFPAMLAVVGKYHPGMWVGWRMRGLAERIAAGESWCEGLVRTKIIGRRDQAVLQAAQRAGNLGWALRGVADSAQRRTVVRLQVALDIGFPIIVTLCAGAIGFLVIGLFIPLVKMISSLT